MNKDLMVKAAIEYQGKWPDGATFLQVGRDEGIRVYSGRAGNHYESEQKAALLCTREQFEDFVDSLFVGAPDDATHFRPNSLAKWYKISEIDGCISVNYFIAGRRKKWMNSASYYEGGVILLNNLIPRPTKKAEPEATYMPKVGEECEAVDYSCGNEDYYQRSFFVGDNPIDSSEGSFKAFSTVEGNDLFWSDKYRPIRTEREIFIEKAIEDYLDQVGSSAVHPRWFGGIFGAMYDKKYRKEADQ